MLRAFAIYVFCFPQLAADGRSVMTDSLTGMYADATLTDPCVPAGGFSNFDSSSGDWAWPGDFDFHNLDAELDSFFACANAAAETVR